MYSGFKLDYNIEDSELYDLGLELFYHDKAIIEERLESFATQKNTLNATNIQNNWFPQIKADIFLSHSHADATKAITLAGFLHSNFGLKTFIDSCVWGYSNDLLKIIDNTFCRNTITGNYSYDKRNYSTSHVHMMLSTALMMMMDNSECLFFFDTPNALNSRDVINYTLSPWIYAELAYSKMIRRRKKAEYRKNLRKAKVEKAIITENFSYFEYEVDILHLINLSDYEITLWNLKNTIKEYLHPLDALYEIVNLE